MSSQKTNAMETTPLLRIPPITSRRFNLWPRPIQPGFYGRKWSNSIWITSNHISSFSLSESVADISANTLLLLDAGGFTDSSASVLNLLQTSQALSFIDSIPAGLKPDEIQLTPLAAQSLGWTGKRKVSDRKITILTMPKATNTLSMRILIRLGTIICLWITQVLVFVVPLLVFSIYTAFFSLGMMLIAGILLALLWEMIPGNSSIKGLIIGMGLSVALFTFYRISGVNINVQLLEATFGIILASAWMGFICNGIRSR